MASVRPCWTANLPTMRAIVTCERPLSTSWGRIVAPSNSRPMGAYTSTSIAWSTGVFSAADPVSSVTGAILAVLEGSGKVRFGCGGAGQTSSDERRVGKELVQRCQLMGTGVHEKKK